MVKVCDVVTINCPLHPETEHLFNDKLIAKMKRGAYLVNTARGKICDRDAIVRALESGQLAGYAGDVWFPQPAPRDHPWRTMPHHGMTPHISGSSLSAQARYAAGTREILECWFDGRPIREKYLIVDGGKLAAAGPFLRRRQRDGRFGRGRALQEGVAVERESRGQVPSPGGTARCVRDTRYDRGCRPRTTADAPVGARPRGRSHRVSMGPLVRSDRHGRADERRGLGTAATPRTGDAADRVRALAADRPVLGVCLGSQLLAHVLGSEVSSSPRKEIGWHRVRLSESGRRDPLSAGTTAEFQGFHWHGDVFDVPPRCESLALSDLTACQAFCSGTSAYGVLFHMEDTESGPLF